MRVPPTTKTGKGRRADLPVDAPPPHNLEAERAVLGSMLLDRDGLARAVEGLGPDDFYRDAHRVIFQAMAEMFGRGEAVDLTTLTYQLEKAAVLEDGGATYLASLLTGEFIAANVGEYIKIVREQSQRRALLKAGQLAQHSALNGGVSVATAEQIRALLDEAVAPSATEARGEPDTSLLDAPDLLDRVADVLDERGLAGDKSNAQVLYLAITSRLLERPINVHVEGPSAGGKTYVVDQVAALLPIDAMYRLTASSERALIYSDTDFAHRVLYIGEAAGIHKDGIGATIMRELVWTGRVAYETTEKDGTGKLVGRQIVKEGPTGLITTSVRAIDGELATRVLTVAVPDDPKFTREVVTEQARRVAAAVPQANVSAFVGAQRWLERHGERRVLIPYATELARLVDVGTVRVRRDFQQLLTLIGVSAFLHQRQRPRDADGRILATIDDYRLVHRLMAQAFSAASAETLSEAQREAVEAVRALCQGGSTVGYQQVADRLAIDKSATWRRLGKAIRAGYVINDEDRRGHPARLKPGDEMPEPRQAIPSPEALSGAYARENPLPRKTTATLQHSVETRATTGFEVLQAGSATPGPLQCNTSPAPDHCTATPLPLQRGAAIPETRATAGSEPEYCSVAVDSDGTTRVPNGDGSAPVTVGHYEELGPGRRQWVANF